MPVMMSKPETMQEVHMTGAAFLQQLQGDLRYALRAMRKSPGLPQ